MELSFLIEYDGTRHESRNDLVREEVAKDNGFELLVIPHTHSELYEVKEMVAQFYPEFRDMHLKH